MSLLRNHSLLANPWHPAYRNVLTRAVVAGLELPSPACMQLQNTLVKELTSPLNILKGRLDYLFIHAIHGGATPFTGINWAQPHLPIGFGAMVLVPKKGVHLSGTGSINYQFQMSTDRVFMTAANDCSFFAMLGTAGGAVTQVETLLSINNGTNYQTIRLRVTPRVDYILNTTTANPDELQAGLPVSQRLYTVDYSLTPSRRSEWLNATKQDEITGGAVGVMPVVATLQAQGITSGRALALIGGGGGLQPGAVNYVAPLYNALNKYMNALNLLP